MARIIKRYSNRKLYDVVDSRYVKLKDIGNYVISGNMIQVLDYESDKDITVKILIQVLLEYGKKNKDVFSSIMLHQIIKYGSSALEKNINAAANQLNLLHHEIYDMNNIEKDEIADLKSKIEKLEKLISDLITISD